MKVVNSYVLFSEKSNIIVGNCYETLLNLGFKIFAVFSLLLIFSPLGIKASTVDYDSVVMSDLPVHYWKLVELAAPVIDSGSGRSNLSSNGTMFGQPGIVPIYPSRPSIAFSLAGIVGLNSQPTYNWSGDLTVEFFIKALTVPSTATTVLGTFNSVETSGGWSVRWSNNALFFYYYQGGAPKVVAFQTLKPRNNTLNHIVIKLTGTEITAVLDGKRETAGLAGIPDGCGNQVISINGRGNNLSHVSVYHTVLSDRQITQHMKAGRGTDADRTTHFVSPNGSLTSDGSLNGPWDLKTALSHPVGLYAGDTIYLRGGTYNVPTEDRGFTSSITGTAEDPVKITSYPGEWAVIDGNVSFSAIKSTTILRINGSNTWFTNFEVTNTETGTRKINVTGSNPPERRANSIDDVGMGTKLINLIIHDTGQGFFASNGVYGNEYYGNIIYNNGWDAPDLTHGHGNYVQNNSGTKLFEDNICFNQFGLNTQAFGSSEAAVRNLTWIGNVFFNGSMAWWGPNISNLTVTDNYTYKNLFKLGNSVSRTNIDANIQNNYFMEGAFLAEFAQNITFRNNTVWYPSNEPLVALNTDTFWAPAKFSIDNNTYYKGHTNIYLGQFRVYYAGSKKRLPIVKRYYGEFAYDRITGSQRTTYERLKKSWKDDFKFDTNSTFIDGDPTGLKVFVRPNRYAAGRGHIIIYNWDQAPTVNVDVSSILNPGDSYELRNVQDYFGDITTGTYDGNRISINMIGRTRAKPIGYDQVSNWYHDPLKPNTFPTFGAFVIIKTTAP